MVLSLVLLLAVWDSSLLNPLVYFFMFVNNHVIVQSIYKDYFISGF